MYLNKNLKHDAPRCNAEALTPARCSANYDTVHAGFKPLCNANESDKGHVEFLALNLPNANFHVFYFIVGRLLLVNCACAAELRVCWAAPLK
jgi:hypothetical protein